MSMRKLVNIKKINQVDIEVSCKKCGSPINRSTKYGLDCVNFCAKKEAIEMLKSNSPEVQLLRAFMPKTFKSLEPKKKKV